MIHIKEIRTGNRVLHNASGTAVTVLKAEEDNVLVEAFPQNSYYSGNEISGIPLTDSILRKLFFTNEETGKWSGHGINIETKPDGFFYGLRISKNRAKIQHLHDLQNYIEDFYALFRQRSYSLNISPL